MYGDNLRNVPAGVDAAHALEAVRKRVWGKDGPAPGTAEATVPYLRSDHMLVRFLIARQWDVENASAMLRDHYKWLAETNMAALLKDPFPEQAHIKKYYPQTFHGTDKRGRPIYIERPGKIDMPRLLQTTTPERLLQYIYAGTELQIRRRLPACSLARGEVVDKSLNIMDLTDLGFRVVTHTTARRVLKDVIGMLQNHYPECSGQVIIINAPKVFSIAWSFVKPMLDEKTVSKISIFGSDREAYTEALLGLVDADQLPALFGGRCKCNGDDAESCMRCVKGPWADPEIMEILDVEPLEYIMTPEGSRLLLHKRANQSTAKGTDSNEELKEETLELKAEPLELKAEPLELVEEPFAPNTGPLELKAEPLELKAEPLEPVEEPSAPNKGPLELKAEPVELQDEHVESKEEMLEAETPTAVSPEGNSSVEHFSEVQSPPADLPGEAVNFEPPLNGHENTLAELKEADLELVLLWEECAEHEDAHRVALAEWVKKSNALMLEIGRDVIYKAQKYYDNQAIWQQLVLELGQKKKEVDRISVELEKCSMNLVTAEAMRQAFFHGDPDLSPEEWARFVPLPPDQEVKAKGADPKLMRNLRVTALSEQVEFLKNKRDIAVAEVDAKTRDVEEAKLSFNQEAAQQSNYTNVKRALPFYEQRQAHEDIIQAQQCILQSMAQRLQKARQRAAQLRFQIKEGGPLSGLPAGVSLENFELAGAEPQEDEYLSCSSEGSNEA